MKMPANFAHWNRSMQGAYRKGSAAFQEGRSLSDCPYADYRKHNGRLTWSRAYIRAWEDGFRDAQTQEHDAKV